MKFQIFLLWMSPVIIICTLHANYQWSRFISSPALESYIQYPFVGKILICGSITEVKGFTHLKTRKKNRSPWRKNISSSFISKYTHPIVVFLRFGEIEAKWLLIDQWLMEIIFKQLSVVEHNLNSSDFLHTLSSKKRM